jgi:transcription elongation factor S-II
MAEQREKEILRIGKSLNEIAASDTPNEQIAMDVLKNLKEFPMTLELLQKSGIGLATNKLRKKFENTELSSFAKKLIKSWKKLVPADQGKVPTPARASSSPVPNPTSNSNGNKGSSGTKPEVKPPKRPPSPLPMKSISVPAKPPTPPPVQFTSGQSSSQGASSDPTPLSPMATISRSISGVVRAASSGSDIRDRCRDMLYKAMKKHVGDSLPSDDDIRFFNLASEIEQCIYQEFMSVDAKYKQRIRSRVSNLGDLKNPDLCKRVITGYIPASKIAIMTSEEMASDSMKQIRKGMIEEGIRDAQMATTGGTKSSLLKCSKCQKRNCTYNQLQTRSADEPMTTFVFCNECGHRWKFC